MAKCKFAGIKIGERIRVVAKDGVCGRCSFVDKSEQLFYGTYAGHKKDATDTLVDVIIREGFGYCPECGLIITHQAIYHDDSLTLQIESTKQAGVKL